MATIERAGEPIAGLCDHGVSIHEHCPACAETPAGPEDEPESDDEGEGEEEEPAGDGEPAAEPEEAEAEPPQDPYSRQCVTCAGWGIVTTGSLVPEHVTRQCETCAGLGFQVRQDSPAQAAPSPDVAADLVAASDRRLEPGWGDWSAPR